MTGRVQAICKSTKIFGKDSLSQSFIADAGVVGLFSSGRDMYLRFHRANSISSNSGECRSVSYIETTDSMSRLASDSEQKTLGTNPRREVAIVVC